MIHQSMLIPSGTLHGLVVFAKRRVLGVATVATGPKRAFGIREGWLDSFICLKIWIARMTYSQTETSSNEQFY